MAQMLEGDVSDMEGAELLAFLDNPLCADGWLHSEFYLHFRRGATYRVHEAMMRTLKGGCLPIALSCSPLPTPVTDRCSRDRRPRSPPPRP